MSENTPIEMTEQDLADVATLHEVPAPTEEPNFHPILEVWREVLKPAAAEAKKRVTPSWAARITAQYKQLNIQDMATFQALYFGFIAELYAILNTVIDGDAECLHAADPAEDLALNAGHYKALIFAWQSTILGWELDWDCRDEQAHIELAAISECHKMFFGEQGITAFLDQIGFRFTDEDSVELTQALEAQRGES